MSKLTVQTEEGRTIVIDNFNAPLPMRPGAPITIHTSGALGGPGTTTGTILTIDRTQDQAEDAVIVVLFSPKGTVLLLKRSTELLHAPGKWGFPGGHIMYGEPPFTAALRELKEETGLVPRSLRYVGRRDLVADQSDLHLFVAEADPGQLDLRLSREHIDWEWLSADEALSYHKDIGNIAGPLTVNVLEHISAGRLRLQSGENATQMVEEWKR